MKLVSIIILNFNGYKFIEKAIKSAINQSYAMKEIICIDNSSNDGSDKLIDKFRGIKKIFLEENVGYSKANNRGIRESNGDYIICLNGDASMDKNFVSSMVILAEKNPDVGMISGKVLKISNCSLYENIIDSTGLFLTSKYTAIDRGFGEVDDGKYSRIKPIFSVSGSCAFYRKKMLEDIKIYDEYFDEEYFAYYEDLDLGWRAQLLGWKCMYNPEAIAYHYRAGSSLGYKFFSKDLMFKRITILNRYYTFIKNMDFRVFYKYFYNFLLVETFIFLYVLFRNIKLTSVFFDLFRNFRKMWKKRLLIRNRIKVEKDYIFKIIFLD